jgi:hypothetical protein
MKDRAIIMSNSETLMSHALGQRVANLQFRLQRARITEREMKTFRKVAAIIEDDQGRIGGDDLIAASFVAGRPGGD